MSKDIHVSYIDPEKKPELARMAHVQNYGSIFVDNDATKKHEEAKSLTEEEITGAIKRSMTSSVRTACFISGSGEASITDTERDGYSGFKDLLDKNGIKTQELPMLQKAEIGKDCTIIVIGRARLTTTFRRCAMLSRNSSTTAERRSSCSLPPSAIAAVRAKAKPELEKMVADWGVTVNNDLVYDIGADAQVFGEAAPVVGPLRFATHRERHGPQRYRIPTVPQPGCEGWRHGKAV